MDLSGFFTRTDLPPDELAHQDSVYGDLTQAVRELADAQLRTLVDLDEVADVASAVRDLTARLLKDARPGPFGVLVDSKGVVRNHGNTVVGRRNPMAMAVGPDAIVWNDNGATASMHLGPLCEGPPGHVHGGVLALVIDQLFGEAAAAAGAAGMTGRLTLSYRRPTPLGDVSMEAWVETAGEIKTIVKGHLKDAEGNITVEAEGLFILPKFARDNSEWPRRKRTFE